MIISLKEFVIDMPIMEFVCLFVNLILQQEKDFFISHFYFSDYISIPKWQRTIIYGKPSIITITKLQYSDPNLVMGLTIFEVRCLIVRNQN